ncbi:MAG: ECF transporter S component [Lysinibacillus sp.]
MNRQKLTLLTLTAMVAAICAVGAVIKVPSPVTSSALDSAPAFLSVVFLPPVFAGIAGMIGHLVSAFSTGFLFGPLHIIIAVEMFLVVWIFGVMHKKGMHVLKWPVALLLNGVVAPIPFYFLISAEFYWGAIVGLSVTTFVNLVIVAVVMPVLSKAFFRKEGRLY